MHTLKLVGLLLLGIYLILAGLMSLAGLSFPYAGIILGLLALISGLFLVISLCSRCCGSSCHTDRHDNPNNNRR